MARELCTDTCRATRHAFRASVRDPRPEARVQRTPRAAEVARAGRQAERDAPRENPADSELSARIYSYELAYRMQTSATDAIDIGKESAATRKLIWVDEEPTQYFDASSDGPPPGRARRAATCRSSPRRKLQALLGRALDLKGNHGRLCAETDKPIRASSRI